MRIVLALTCSAMILACARGVERPAILHETTSGIELLRVEPGVFTMGSPPSVVGREPQETEHRVSLSRGFYLGRSEVTQQQWKRVMGSNPSHFSSCGPDCPVERVSHDDVRTFLERLNSSGSGGFRLPTEAEWEYACRAGGDAPFGHRATLGALDANIDGRFPYAAPPGPESTGTKPAGSFTPNPWGLVDMTGNVWEWVDDPWCPYPDGPVTDPHAGCQSQYRVIRGGSWKFDGNSARCALRYTHRPQHRGYSLGFRIAHDAPGRVR
jgi:formylglycine-generating enzyme required for sulfatase activity